MLLLFPFAGDLLTACSVWTWAKCRDHRAPQPSSLMQPEPVPAGCMLQGWWEPSEISVTHAGHRDGGCWERCELCPGKSISISPGSLSVLVKGECKPSDQSHGCSLQSAGIGKLGQLDNWTAVMQGPTQLLGLLVLHAGLYLQPRCAGRIKHRVLQSHEVENQSAIFKNNEKDQVSGGELKEQ